MSRVVLSIIIPVYNTREYIEECLNSIFEQNESPDKFEVIVINDGSTDGSQAVIDTVCDNKSNCRIFTYTNRGLSVARNTGLDKAIGEYVWFVDSDDKVEIGAIATLLEYIRNSQADIYCLGGRRIFEYSDAKPKMELFLPPRNGYVGLAPLHVFKRMFLKNNGLSFLEGIFHEDFEFIPRATFLAKKIDFIDYPLYLIRKRRGSITTSVNPKRAFDMLRVADSLWRFQSEHSAVGCDMNFKIALALNNSLQNTVGNFSMSRADEHRLNNEFCKNKHLWICLWNSGALKYRVEYLLFFLFRANIVKIFKFIKKFDFHGQ